MSILSSKKSTNQSQQLAVFEFPKLISLRDNGSSVEGVFEGIQTLPGRGIANNDLHFAVLKKDNEFIACVAGSEILRFLQNFKVGYHLKIIKVDTIRTSKGQTISHYRFEYDPNGLIHPFGNIPQLLQNSQGELPL